MSGIWSPTGEQVKSWGQVSRPLPRPPPPLWLNLAGLQTLHPQRRAGGGPAGRPAWGRGSGRWCAAPPAAHPLRRRGRGPTRPAGAGPPPDPGPTAGYPRSALWSPNQVGVPSKQILSTGASLSTFKRTSRWQPLGGKSYG